MGRSLALPLVLSVVACTAPPTFDGGNAEAFSPPADGHRAQSVLHPIVAPSLNALAPQAGWCP